MKFILNILTLGIFSLFSKAKDVDLKTTKRKYREDGTLKKEVLRDVDYSEGEGQTELPK